MRKAENKQSSLPWFGLPKLAPFLKPYALLVAGIAGLGLLRSVVDVFLPLFQRYAINHFIGENNRRLSVVLRPLFAALAVRSPSATALFVLAMHWIGTGRDMRKKIFEHLQTSPSPITTNSVDTFSPGL